MDAARLIEIAKRLVDVDQRSCMDRVDGPKVIDTARYTDPARHRLEVDRIFRREPQLIGFSGDIAEPGSFFATDLGRLPVLVTRAPDGAPRAFVNACRHRGMQVAEGAGSAARFTCPYHSWTYDGSDGRLVAAPDPGAFDGCDLDAQGLIPLPIAEGHGLLVVSPDPSVPVDIDDVLGPLGPELAHFDLAQLRPVTSRTTVARCNWKLANDMGMEGYHVRYLHAATLPGTPPYCIHDRFGRHQRLGFASPGLFAPGTLDQPDQLLHHLSLPTYLYPSSAIVLGATVIYQRVVPAATPGECIVHLGTYSWGPLPSDEARAGAEAFFEFMWRLTLDEDLWAQEACQRSFESGLVDTIVFGANEPALHASHDAWDAAIA